VRRVRRAVGVRRPAGRSGWPSLSTRPGPAAHPVRRRAGCPPTSSTATKVSSVQPASAAAHRNPAPVANRDSTALVCSEISRGITILLPSEGSMGAPAVADRVISLPPARSAIHSVALTPRVRRAPRLEPPYDDELTGPPLRLVPIQEELPFDEPAPRRFERPVDFFDPQPTSRLQLPTPEPWAARFIQAVLEMLVGRRPAAQLHEWTSAPVLAGLINASGRRRWATPGLPPPIVRSIRVYEPADGVAEMCAVIQRGRRYFAAAGRLEGFDGRWQCVALRLG
jgi:Family of unknown function (DUF6459)